VTGKPKPRPKKFRYWFAFITRWLHIYVSLFGLAVILFFSLTGLTLNHPSWFFSESTSHANGQLDRAWLHNGAVRTPKSDESDWSYDLSKLEVVEYLRKTHAIHGSLSDLLAFEDECELTFEGPGYAATARINRNDGSYVLDTTSNDLVSVMNDLHKGRHTGPTWSVLIDVSAVIGILTGVSGFLLVFFLRLRRSTGLITAGIGLVVLCVLYIVATR
jgi:uncharacterized protein